MDLPLDTIPALKVPLTARTPASHVPLNPAGKAPLALICDHASKALPREYGTLGLDPALLTRHIALDIGAACLTAYLSAALDARAIMASFSRLLVDPNRASDDPSLIPEESDGIEIPGNRALAHAERRSRIARFHESYHEAAAEMLQTMADSGGVPAFVGVHSFTPVMAGFERPWHIGILWSQDARLAGYMVDWLRRESDVCVGEQEPYSGHETGYSMDRQGGGTGYPHAVIEVRQDLIDTHHGVAEWGALIARLLQDLARDMAPFTRRPGARNEGDGE